MGMAETKDASQRGRVWAFDWMKTVEETDKLEYVTVQGDMYKVQGKVAK